jgi:uncharacterized protein YndB with AHSA1/START domain
MSDRTHTLRIVRDLKHERARIFSALTDPAKMAQWFFAYPGGSATVRNDLRPGGEYVIQMKGGDDSCSPHGTYVEITPPSRLVFLWRLDQLGLDTKVTVELFEQAGGTRLVLSHELPEPQVTPHEQGWNQCLDHLAAALAAHP